MMLTYVASPPAGQEALRASALACSIILKVGNKFQQVSILTLAIKLLVNTLIRVPLKTLIRLKLKYFYQIKFPFYTGEFF